MTDRAFDRVVLTVGAISAVSLAGLPFTSPKTTSHSRRRWPA